MDAVFKRIEELRCELARIGKIGDEEIDLLFKTILCNDDTSQNSQKIRAELANDFNNLSQSLLNLAKFIDEKLPS